MIRIENEHKNGQTQDESGKQKTVTEGERQSFGSKPSSYMFEINIYKIYIYVGEKERDNGKQ